MVDMLHGKLILLTAEDPSTMARLYTGSAADSEYLRLLDWDPARAFSLKKHQDWFEKHYEEMLAHNFMIRTLQGNHPIGFIGLDAPRWNHGDTFLGIGIGPRDFWSKGYGTDAMRVILRYAFHELNLHRVTLNVFEYNQRAIRSYQKAGFAIEGCEQNAVCREGRRWNVIYMGILREEWIEQYDKHHT